MRQELQLELADDRTKPDLWSAIERFRATTDLEALDVDAVLEDVRDPSPGRGPEL
jgi:cytochrome c556